ncbi:MAG TPA: DHH family phosphoesterase [Desulfovibrio sp.]|jgi:nanoRNase/pAp phosphatase (c-di-AMP/oligoRNAs hydrolase)|uniref:DHH family phosphoesterase n=1 Tax=Desulfovibrio TaxID=872 RepID=UPI0004119CA0|nr:MULTISPECIES: DHH family phosphoesterase [Desulfovibrio]MDY0306538.1 DHH family phosphoesterase [Desulfovibrionaceae bacterium]HMM38257.1 DHH family phosphoesterase [Desulfovibrio sp.]
MALFRQLDEQISQMLALLNKDQRWLIVINADPDALGAALALRHIFKRRVLDVGIGHINEIKRPDNLSMIRFLRIPTRKIIPNLAAQYDKFAMVDSQPHHNPAFDQFQFSIVIDHHPILPDKPVNAPFVDIRPKYGATATMLTEYLYNLHIRPPKLLATALLYAIKADSAGFERSFIDADVTAFKYLTKHADPAILNRIARSDFLLDWMRYFSRAFYNLRRIGQGLYAHMGKVENPDILVIVADFFTRVYGVSWNAVSGEYNDKIVAIFRGDGVRRDMGKMAASLFGEIGSAGGHKGAARAEFDQAALDGKDPESFIVKKLSRGKTQNVQRI